MFSQGSLFFLRTLTHTRVGAAAGEDGLDLPLCRDAQGQAYLPFSAVRGAVRQQVQERQEEWAQRSFGEGGHRSSLLSFTDQKLLLWPAAADFRCWLTSREALTEVRRLAEKLGASSLPALPSSTAAEALVSGASGKWVVGEETLRVTCAPEIAAWEAWLEACCGLKLAGKVAVVSAARLQTFSCRTSQVASRLRLQEESRTAAKGAFWYEEYLPEDTVFAGGVLAMEPRLYDAQTGETAAQLLEKLGAALAEPMPIGAATSRGGGMVQGTLGSPAAQQPHGTNPSAKDSSAEPVQSGASQKDTAAKSDAWQRKQKQKQKHKKK